MNDIENRIKKAQSDSAELEQLLGDYLPLLKSRPARPQLRFWIMKTGSVSPC